MRFCSISLRALVCVVVIMRLLNTIVAANIDGLCKAVKDDPAHTEQVTAWNDPAKKNKKTYAVRLRCNDDGKSIKSCHPELLPKDDDEADEGVEALSAAALRDSSLPQEKGLVMTCLSGDLPIFTIKELGFANGVCRKRDGEKKEAVKAVNKSILGSFEVEFQCQSHAIIKCKPQDMWYSAGRSAWIKPRGTISGYMVACHKFSEPTIVKLKSEPKDDLKNTVHYMPNKQLLV